MAPIRYQVLRHSSLETCSSMNFHDNRKALLPPQWLLAWTSIWNSDQEGRLGDCRDAEGQEVSAHGSFAYDTHHLAEREDFRGVTFRQQEERKQNQVALCSSRPEARVSQ